MNAVNIVKTAVWIALLAGMSAAGIKYIAVVETGIDERSGAAAEITSAEVALITAELRREAVKNLPRDRFSVMTSETVQSMGGAVLEECSEENCVITLGSRIGADYIVRGTISKFRTRLTLSIEIYETDNGTLVAFSDPIRSENAAELLEKSAPVCAEMYKTFAAEQNSTRKQPALEHPPVAPAQEQPAKPQIAPAPQAPKLKRSFWAGLAADVAGAGLLVYGVYQNGNIKEYNDVGVYKNIGEYNDAKSSETRRNIGYTIGSIILLSGISVHIFF